MSADPLQALVLRELALVDPGSKLAHHALRHCRQALDALERGERHVVRLHLGEARALRDVVTCEVGARALTSAEHAELLRLCAARTEA
jgi:hypothetical protein